MKDNMHSIKSENLKDMLILHRFFSVSIISAVLFLTANYSVYADTTTGSTITGNTITGSTITGNTIAGGSIYTSLPGYGASGSSGSGSGSGSGVSGATSASPQASFSQPIVYSSNGFALPRCWITSSPQYIYPGGSAVLSWNSSDAYTGYVSGNGANITVSTQPGSYTVSPTQTTQYIANFSGYGGSGSCYTTVVVQSGSALTQSASQNPSQNNQQAAAVTLSQVPYTGLDLGPVGTIIYWSALFFICAAFAYYVSVRKVQNSFASWLRIRFIGDGSIVSHPAYTNQLQVNDAQQNSLPAEEPKINLKANCAGYTDQFIFEQIFKLK